MEETISIETNQKDCLEIAKNELSAAQTRMRDLDGKLNMLLVFLSALIVFIGTVVSMSYDKMCTAVFVLISISMVAIAGAAIAISIGLVPQKYHTVDSNSLKDVSIYNLNRNDFLKFYLEAYAFCLGEINVICKKKGVKATISTYLLIFAFILLMVAVIIAVEVYKI